MMKKIILLFLVLLSSTVYSQEEAQKLLKKYSFHTSSIKRMDVFSKHFLGLPYGVGGPLGEGPNARFDQDPLYRFDTFDCTTYVETVLALTLSKNLSEFEKWMNDIRYEDGKIDYLTRNHFPSLQWIPNNIRNGVLKEINSSIVGKDHIKTANAIINLPNWLKSIKIEEIKVPLASPEEKEMLLQELKGFSASVLPSPASLEYISISFLISNPSILYRIPSGTIVNFVRPNWDLRDLIGTHMNVSHQGLLFKKGTKLYLRHASTSGEKVVMELPFIDYLKKFRNHSTLKGVHFMGLN